MKSCSSEASIPLLYSATQLYPSSPPWTGPGTTGQAGGNGYWAEEARVVKARTDSMLGAAGDKHWAQPSTCFGCYLSATYSEFLFYSSYPGLPRPPSLQLSQVWRWWLSGQYASFSSNKASLIQLKIPATWRSPHCQARPPKEIAGTEGAAVTLSHPYPSPWFP